MASHEKSRRLKQFAGIVIILLSFTIVKRMIQSSALLRGGAETLFKAMKTAWKIVYASPIRAVSTKRVR